MTTEFPAEGIGELFPGELLQSNVKNRGAVAICSRTRLFFMTKDYGKELAQISASDIDSVQEMNGVAQISHSSEGKKGTINFNPTTDLKRFIRLITPIDPKIFNRESSQYKGIQSDYFTPDLTSLLIPKLITIVTDIADIYGSSKSNIKTYLSLLLLVLRGQYPKTNENDFEENIDQLFNIFSLKVMEISMKTLIKLANMPEKDDVAIEFRKWMNDSLTATLLMAPGSDQLNTGSLLSSIITTKIIGLGSSTKEQAEDLLHQIQTKLPKLEPHVMLLYDILVFYFCNNACDGYEFDAKIINDALFVYVSKPTPENKQLVKTAATVLKDNILAKENQLRYTYIFSFVLMAQTIWDEL